MTVKARIVVMTGERIDVDVDIALEAAPSFVLGCHFSMPGASIYMEGELIDAAELAATLLPATPASAPIPASAPVDAAPAPIQLSDFKTITEFMHASLAALTKLQLETFGSFSASARQLFEEEMKRIREFAKECSDQRQQHRRALNEIDTFDRGTKVAFTAEQAAFRAGQSGRRKPEAEGFTAGDFIAGFSTIGG